MNAFRSEGEHMLEEIFSMEFFYPSKKLKQFAILSSVSNGRISVREISRRFGLSVGLVSEYIKDLQASGFITEDHHLTQAGRSILQELEKNARNEMLSFSDLVTESMATEEIRVSSVASQSAFALESSIRQIGLAPVRYRFFSRGYETVREGKDSHYFVIGNIPAMKLKSFGIPLEVRKSLLEEKHFIVSHSDSETLAVVGQSSVSASLLYSSQYFGIEGLKRYKNIIYTSNLTESVEIVKEKRSDALLWEPFASFVEHKYGYEKVFSFPQADLYSQVLVKNTGVYLEAKLQSAFEDSVEKLLGRDRKFDEYFDRVSVFLNAGSEKTIQ
jgi:DNA-binding MarR family transcriptional regulator